MMVLMGIPLEYSPMYYNEPDQTPVEILQHYTKIWVSCCLILALTHFITMYGAKVNYGKLGTNVT
jgi:hypothetical protein